MTARTKFGNIKVKIDGYTFASEKESNRYLELKLLLRAGEISDLKLHPKFALIPSQKLSTGKRERPCTYTADYSYIQDGKIVVEDSKSKKDRKGKIISATQQYVIRRKLMLWIYGIEILET
jgi:hypothetical protein